MAEARRRPHAFVVGVDAVAEAMADASRRVVAKPSRGGIGNAMFLCTAAEILPGLLAGAADEITVNYPWGSLLRAVAMPDADVLARLAALGKQGARFTALINMQPLRDGVQAEKLGLGETALLRGPERLEAIYTRAGLEDLRIRDASGDPLPETSWAKHLAVSKREVWRLDARVQR